MADHNILSKLDRALVAYLISVGAGTADDVYPAKRSDEKGLPCTVCYSQSASLVHPFTGDWAIDVSIMVKTDPCIDVDQDAAEPKATSEARVAATFDAFFAGLDSTGDKLAEAITAAVRASGDADLATFTVINVTPKTVEAGFDQKGNAWIDTLDLEIICCSADVL